MTMQVQLGGLLGAALEANRKGRLSRFIVDECSPAIALFAPQHRDTNHEGDWYGEHAGKWLSAAARAAARSGDTALTANVLRVADFLVAQQESDGYLGTYARERRFPVKQPKGPPTWDGAPGMRTWDIWTHSYLILGMLEVHRQFGQSRHLDCARRMADLCLWALTEGGVDITDLGNHHGMSATVLLDPAADLYLTTGEARYLRLARLVLAQADARPELALLQRALAGADAAEIATGKAYQLCWNLVGLAKLHRATGEAAYLDAVRKLWTSIRDHHLSLGGGPWGGVAHRSREVFNWQGAFSPYGYVETCSTFSWIQLNRELLAITGEAAYAEEIERAAYNDLLGAQAPNGEDWCYYSFPNGRRVHTTYWRCCKSSGALALEELPPLAYTVRGDELAVNLYGPSEATLTLPCGAVHITQATRYPYDGEIRLTIEAAGHFTLALRIPAWAHGARARVNGAAPAAARVAGTYLRIERGWSAGDAVILQLPMRPTLHRRANQNIQESRAPGGVPVAQQVLHFEYAAITRGPLVYATGLIDDFKIEETIRLPADLANALEDRPGDPPAICLHLGYRPPLTFTPYFSADARTDGRWRLTWLQLAPR